MKLKDFDEVESERKHQRFMAKMDRLRANQDQSKRLLDLAEQIVRSGHATESQLDTVIHLLRDVQERLTDFGRMIEEADADVRDDLNQAQRIAEVARERAAEPQSPSSMRYLRIAALAASIMFALFGSPFPIDAGTLALL